MKINNVEIEYFTSASKLITISSYLVLLVLAAYCQKVFWQLDFQYLDVAPGSLQEKVAPI